jgi:hypothetical protein
MGGIVGIGVVPRRYVGCSFGEEVCSHLGSRVRYAIDSLRDDRSAGAGSTGLILLEETCIRVMKDFTAKLQAVFSSQVKEIVAIFLDILIEDLRVVIRRPTVTVPKVMAWEA